MIFVFGERLYGKVDEVPGLFHLATAFFHIQFIPFIPTRSCLMLHGTNRGVRMRMSGKSVLFAYIRMVLLLGCIVSCIAAFALFGDNKAGRKNDLPVTLGFFAVGVLCLLVFLLSYRFSRPSPLRAFRLASEAGFPIPLLAEFYAKRLSPEEIEDLARRADFSAESSSGSEQPL